MDIRDRRLRRGAERFRHRVSTPRDYEGSLRAIEEMVALIERTVGERGTVGIGIPGTVSQRTGIVKNANSTWLIGKPLERVLEERLSRPVRLMNDANCFTLSEATDDANPYSTPLAHCSASASSLNSCTVMTGPNTSDWMSSSSWRRPSTTVGAKQ